MDRRQELEVIQRALNTEGGQKLMVEMAAYLDPMETARIGESDTDIIIRAARRDVFKVLQMMQSGEYR